MTPAADIPRTVGKRKQKLIIGNLQKTPLSSMATVNIHAFSDTIMQGLMQRLNIEIPVWIVRRRVRITRDENSTILIEGRDPDNQSIPFSLFKSIRVKSGEKLLTTLNSEPFAFQVPENHTGPLDIQLNFFEHYNEIPYELHYDRLNEIPLKEEFYLFYKSNDWEMA